MAWDFPRDDMFFIGGVLGLSNAIKFFAVFAAWAFCAWRLREAVRAGKEPTPDISPAAAALAA